MIHARSENRPVSKARACSMLLAALFASAGDTVAQTQPATVTGTVRDSVANTPLASAIVQLASADDAKPFNRTVNADSLGHFTFTGIPDGQYKLGFFHPMLDSLGIEAPLRDVFVDKLRPVRMDLGIPSAETLSKALCRGQTRTRTVSDVGGVVVGFVRDGRTKASVPNATVAVQWAEMTISAKGIEHRLPRQVVRASSEGWFLFCDVPSSGPVQLFATAAADSTDRIDVQMPSALLLRRDLYVGPSLPQGTRTAGAAPSAQAALSRGGTQRLRGVVLTAVGNQPVAGAEVRLVNGEVVRANEKGEWTFPELQVGTRMLEMRAIGYYPIRQPVDVVEGALPMRVEMVTLKSVLDTVRVRAAVVQRNMAGFAERRKSTGGKFLTAEDVERRQPTVASEMFNAVAGVRLQRDQNGQTDVLIRGMNEDPCPANFFLDGVDIGPLKAEEVDSYVRPQNIAGIEVYAGASVPGQFSRGLNGNACGSIVIWTK